MKRFVYYQPNEMDLKDEYGDCTIRALSKFFDCTWIEAFDIQVPLCRKYQVSNIFDVPSYIERKFMAELDLKYTGISNKKGTKRPTVDSFAKDHPRGRYILNVANHEVCVVDGRYFDTWDCGKKSLYGYYTKGEER